MFPLIEPTAGRRIPSEWRAAAREANYRPSRFAALLGISLRTLQRQFRTQFGMTVTDWMASVRLEQAGWRIKAGQRVKEVALDLGYKQLSHFSREFKKVFGVPPTAVGPTPFRITIALQSRAIRRSAPRETVQLRPIAKP